MGYLRGPETVRYYRLAEEQRDGSDRVRAPFLFREGKFQAGWTKS